ncbi:hypothetical protein QL285_097520 [Trifolium repens]|nr:hypothetical protein QL285_098392 [Trifolium repens]KAK2350387.1 hypothetical protein QL285_098261 [Trifolium repens]KAK2351123.1 hypothetical protein QL285_097520 [Trifolium repens]
MLFRPPTTMIMQLSPLSGVPSYTDEHANPRNFTVAKLQHALLLLAYSIKFHSTRDSLSVLAASSSMLSLCLLFGMGQNRNIPFHPVKRGTLSYRLFGLEHKSHSWISRLLIQLAIAGSQLAPNLLTLFPGQLT